MRPESEQEERRTLDASELLRSHGLRTTVARRAVIEALVAAAVPMSHGEMIEALVTKAFDRATVYRVLVDLEEAGILLRTDLGDRLWRFELDDAGAHGRDHPHFVCTTCNAVSCLPKVELALTSTHDAPLALVAGLYALRVAGVCDACHGGPIRQRPRSPTRPRSSQSRKERTK